MERRTRSGASFSPFNTPLTGISTNVCLAPLITQALCNEAQRDGSNEGDNEGMDLSPVSQRLSKSVPNLTCSNPGPTNSPPTPSLMPKTHVEPQMGTSIIPALSERPQSLRLLPSSTTTSGSSRTTRDIRNKSRSKIRRKVKEKNALSELPSPAYQHRPRTTAALKAAGLGSSQVYLTSESLPAAHGRWVGKRIEPLQKHIWTIEACQAFGLELVNWDGRTPYTFTDDSARSMVTLVGCPCDESWSSAVVGASRLMGDVRSWGEGRGAFTAAQSDHRRGHFVALACGVSYGGGQQAPGNLVHSKARRMLLDTLLDDHNIQRLAGFQSSAFAYYVPKLYRHYATSLTQLYSHDRNLDINFTNSIFPATTFNLGPETISLDHTDPGNIAYGMCALTALGNYNPDLGGHLLLFDLNKMVRFPPGSTILLASSILRHGNSPIQDGEHRMSLSQYCTGGLFRWVKYGFQTAESLLGTPGGKYLKHELDGDDEEKTAQALSLFSKIDELEYDRQCVFSKPICVL
ncbi:hypothetical protein BDZ94DRAFT_1259834 [Collybia nuda]|uniref:Uncharacterized protein n=1 Tax=Collybia nuda TaxID=64659 RepID=A0A9P6CEL5_9AGAR|nr:hypothetical protein BDZ94DRAFT_1259834 [Collybia nuda]